LTSQNPFPFALRSLQAAALFAFLLFPFAFASAQSATATLSGTVEDQNGAVVPGATVTVKNPNTGLNRQTTTNDAGYFTVALLTPGTYTVRAQHDGFKIVQIDIVLNVGDQKALQIQLPTGDVKEVVNVTGEAPLISESPAVGTVVDRQFVANLPLNGRSFNTLFELTPGTVLFTGNISSGGVERDNFSINGQRADANYTTVDGVGANVGSNLFAGPGQNESGSVMARNVQGGTSNLVSMDALQEFKIQTSTYAPEFGHTPGGQISIVTRSGTNQFHGTAFNYFRNDVLDANDWFNNANRLGKPPLRQNNFGGVLGGPLPLPHFGEGGPFFDSGKDRTFFFFSYEGLRLLQPTTTILDVPSLSARQATPAAIKPFLDAFPLPNGPATTNGFATLAASYSNPSTLNATSIRIDHTVNSKLSLFGRYNHAPSNTVTRGLGGSLNFLFDTDQETDTATAGATFVISPRLNNEFRANYTRTRGASIFNQDSFGGAIPLPDSALPSLFVPGQSSFVFILGGNQARYNLGVNNDNFQRQINLVDNMSLIKGAHTLKFGLDYRRLSPIIGSSDYQLAAIFNGATGANGAPTPGTAISGITSSAQVVNRVADSFPVFTNYSAYAQDTWHAGWRLTLTYGLRWDLNPTPTQGKGEPPYVVTGLNNLATVALAPRGTQLYATTYGNLAPRVGVSYQLSQQGKETLLRGGLGIFYDLGYGNIAQAFTGIPYSRSVTLPGAAFPLSPALSVPPPLTFSPPYSLIRGSAPDLKLPRTYQWNVAIEQSLGASQKFSASYVGAAGRSLLRQEVISGSFLNPNFTELDITRNTGRSDYHALQLQFVRRLSRGLQALASYTWSHSLDNSSGDSLFAVASEAIAPEVDRGPSDFDVRHSFSAAVTYDLPAPSLPAAGKAILGNWSVDFIVRGRTALPVNVVAGFPSPRVLGAVGARPDLVPGVPLYIDDPLVAGGRRINRAAFSTVSIPKNATGTFLRQGTLGRNALRGFNAFQLDLSLHRQFGLTERIKLQFRAELFNIFNHPNFANPVVTLSSGTFGQSTQMLGRGLGGLSTLYQIGGPRSTQLVVRLSF
jgi:hypothetical protein